MTWEWFNTAAGAASLMGLVLGVILGAVTWLQSRDTKKILERMDTRNLAHHAQTQAMLERMDRAAEQRDAALKALIERRNAC